MQITLKIVKKIKLLYYNMKSVVTHKKTVFTVVSWSMLQYTNSSILSMLQYTNSSNISLLLYNEKLSFNFANKFLFYFYFIYFFNYHFLVKLQKKCAKIQHFSSTKWGKESERTHCNCLQKFQLFLNYHWKILFYKK